MKDTVTIGLEEYLVLRDFQDQMYRDNVARFETHYGEQVTYITKDEAIQKLAFENNALAQKANRIEAEIGEMRRQRVLYEREIRKEIERQVWSKHNLWGSFKKFIGIDE